MSKPFKNQLYILYFERIKLCRVPTRTRTHPLTHTCDAGSHRTVQHLNMTKGTWSITCLFAVHRRWKSCNCSVTQCYSKSGKYLANTQHHSIVMLSVIYNSLSSPFEVARWLGKKVRGKIEKRKFSWHLSLMELVWRLQDAVIVKRHFLRVFFYYSMR